MRDIRPQSVAYAVGAALCALLALARIFDLGDAAMGSSAAQEVPAARYVEVVIITDPRWGLCHLEIYTSSGVSATAEVVADCADVFGSDADAEGKHFSITIEGDPCVARVWSAYAPAGTDPGNVGYVFATLPCDESSRAEGPG